MSEMHDILNRLQRLNESAQPVIEGSMKHMMHADAERMSRKQFVDKYGDEHGEFWDNIMGDLEDEEVNEGKKAALDYDKVLEAIAALYGPDIYDNDAMGDLADDLEQANPTTQELEFIIQKGRLPMRLRHTKFTNNDDIQFGTNEGKKAALDYDKVLEAIAALYGPDIYDNDAMGDLADDLEQANPTTQELEFIIQKGRLPMRLRHTKFTNNDDIQFGTNEGKKIKQSAIAEGVARIEAKLLKEFTEFKEGKAFPASGVRADKRGKYNSVHRDYYHVKLEKDNVTKAERVLADNGESESDVKSNAKRDNPGWKVVSVRKVDTTDDKQGTTSSHYRGRTKKIDVDEAQAKPDYLDVDGDGDKKEPMKKAAKDKKKKQG